MGTGTKGGRTHMASDQQPNEGRESAPRDAKSPDWADGLKQLYDAVVEEPLPDAFKDLLDKLDENDPSEDVSSNGAP